MVGNYSIVCVYVYIYIIETHGLENTFKSSRLIGLIAKVIKDDQST